MDVAEDDNDNDWNFVPTNIISHAKRIIPRKVKKKFIEDKLVLMVERKAHMRIQVLWKD